MPDILIRKEGHAGRITLNRPDALNALTYEMCLEIEAALDLIPLTLADDPGDEIAAMDVGQFALGAVRRTAELYTRSDSRVETRNNTTIVTEDNPDPNILAGVLEGGTDAILDSITERNRQAIATLESRPPIWVLDAGTPVQIFVNQSMQLPQ